MRAASGGGPEAAPGPLACTENVKGAQRLCALNAAARGRGLRNGQGLAEARAMCPDLDAVPADPAADRKLIEALSDWADRYTPLVGCDLPDGLFLDITGCAHLFGGERALLEDCLLRLFHLGFETTGAIAPTPALAWALARHDHGRVAQLADVPALAPPLPLSALRLPEGEVAALARVGLKRVGDIVEAPRAPLARRFGAILLSRLDRLLGRESEPISPRRPVAELMAERRLAEPVTDLDAVEALAGQLARNLEEALARRGAGIRQAELSLYRLDGAVRRILVGTARPVRDPVHVLRLFSERLAALHDEIDAGYGFEVIRLSVPVLEPLDPAQTGFSGKEGNADMALETLADRLAARLGAERVVRPVACDSHIPERALALVPQEAVAAGAAQHPEAFRPASGAARPLRLFCHPEPVTAVAEVPEGPPITFNWRRSRHRVTRAEGPERIAPEWWLDGEAAPARDYYRVEDEAGRRYWLFREGLYDRDSVPPRWFLHGFFP